jgi:hypothetical protein
MACRRGWHSMVKYDQKVFIIGGFDGAKRLNTCELYDIKRSHHEF